MPRKKILNLFVLKILRPNNSFDRIQIKSFELREEWETPEKTCHTYGLWVCLAVGYETTCGRFDFLGSYEGVKL